MKIWIASTSWLLWKTLLWTWMSKYLLETLLSVLLDIYTEVGYLEPMIILYLQFWAFFFFFSIFLPLKKFFNWRVITLQNFVVFCQRSTRISHRYTHVPSLLSPSPSHPSRLSQSPSLVTAPFYIPTNRVLLFQFIHNLANTCYFLFLVLLLAALMAPPPVLLPGKSHGWRSLVGCSPWGC